MSSNANYFLNNRPAWVDLSSPDPEASRNFYSQLLGWDIQVNPDPQYGGYAMATDAGVGVAGIGPKMDPNAPTAWSLYIGTDDAAALAQRVTDNGGKVVAAPFDVGDQGKMAVFQDPSGAFFSALAGERHARLCLSPARRLRLGRAECAQRRERPALLREGLWLGGADDAGRRLGDSSQPPYHEFTLEGESILGAWEMNPMVPAGVPNYWQVYFGVEDVDFVAAVAERLGAKTMVAPQAMPGGKFAILTDPQGASFGLLHFEAPEGE